MRLSNLCDSMNVTGCDAFHESVANYKGFSYLIYHYQVECAIVTAVLIFGITMFLVLRKVRKEVQAELKKEKSK